MDDLPTLNAREQRRLPRPGCRYPPRTFFVHLSHVCPPSSLCVISQHPDIERQVRQLRVPRSPRLTHQMLLLPQLPVDCRMVIHLRAHHKSKTLLVLLDEAVASRFQLTVTDCRPLKLALEYNNDNSGLTAYYRSAVLLTSLMLH